MTLTEMKNIGRAMQQKLNAANIDSAEELIRLGSREVFLRLKAIYPEVCLVHLYALQGAIDNVSVEELPQETRAELKAFSDKVK